MRANKSSLRSTVRSFPFAVAAALVVSGCSNTPFARVGEYQRAQHDARLASLAERAPEQPSPPTQLTRPDERDYVASATYWGAQVQANPDDVDAHLNFSRNLRMMGGASQAVTVMRSLVLRDPNNPRVLAEYGKSLTAAERPEDAIGFLTQAIQLSPNDWTLLSARGVAYDQTSNHTAARADYQQALAIDQDNPTVQTNLALSYVLAGQPQLAEPLLRQVVARANATAAMRQNLAMVLALQGKSAEATEMGKVDLEPEDAASNTRLFAQFEGRASVTPVVTPSAPQKPIETSGITAGRKLQVSAADDVMTIKPVPAAEPISGDPMATPAAVATATPQPAGNRAGHMMPVADDTTSPPSSPAKPKPVKRAAPKSIPAVAAATPTPAPRPVRPTTANGETLITTINGIPVISDVKPKGKPSASADGLLRRGAL